MIVIKRGGRRFGPVCNYWSPDSSHCDIHACHHHPLPFPSSVNSIGTSQTPPHHSHCSHHTCTDTLWSSGMAWAPSLQSQFEHYTPSLLFSSLLLSLVANRACSCWCIKQQCSISYDDVSGAATGQGITNLFGRLAVVSTHMSAAFNSKPSAFLGWCMLEGVS